MGFLELADDVIGSFRLSYDDPVEPTVRVQEGKILNGAEEIPVHRSLT